MLREGGCAAAHAYGKLAAVDHDRPLEEAHQAAGAPLDFVDRAGVGEHESELIAAQARDEARFAAHLPEALADAHQHPVAELVTEAVVHRLEVVQVEEQHRQLSPTRRWQRSSRSAAKELASVRQVRQRIVPASASYGPSRRGPRAAAFRCCAARSRHQLALAIWLNAWASSSTSLRTSAADPGREVTAARRRAPAVGRRTSR
jgi:hypothetical protein